MFRLSTGPSSESVSRMEVEIEELGPCRKRLKVVVPADRVGAHLEETFKAVNQRIRMRGFRPGKIPRRVLEARLGDEIRAQAKETLIEESFREAVRAHAIDFVGSPKLDVGDEALEEGRELSFSVELDTKPEVVVGEVEKIEVKARSTEPGEDEVEAALEELARTKRRLQKVEDGLEEGDFAKVDLCFRHEGRTILERKGLQIHARIPVAGTDPEEFQAKLKGSKAGDEVVVPLRFPDQFEKEEVRGKDGDVVVKVHEVLRFVSPPIDDELAKSLRFESLEELRADLRAKMAEEKAKEEERRQEEEILDALYAEHPFELPESLVQDELRHRLDHYARELERSGAPKEEIEKRIAEIRDEARKGAERALRDLFLCEAVAKKKKLFVTEDDVAAEIRRIASEHGVEPAKVRAKFEEDRLLPELRLELMSRKVREWLRKTAKLVDSEGAEAGA